VTWGRTTPEADAQGREIDAWWRNHRPAAADLFFRELSDCLALLAEAPAAGQRYLRYRIPGLRRMLLRDSGYHVYYIFDEVSDDVEVIAIWSARRGRGPSPHR